MKIWTCGSSPWSGSRNAWTRIINVNGVSRLSNIWNFFGTIQMISCRDWWTWTKPGYITMTRRQRKNQRSCGIAAHPTPKKFQVQKSAGIVLASIRVFLESRRHPPHWLSSKGPDYQRGVLLISAGATEEHFERKSPREGRLPRGSCSFTKITRITGHLQPGRNWPAWASSILITHSVLRIWQRRTIACSLDWKKTIDRSSFFVRRGGHCCRGHLVGIYFFEWLAKVREKG